MLRGSLHLFLTLALAAFALGPGQRAMAAPGAAPSDIQCYRAAGPDGSPKKFCESERIVTVGPLADGLPLTQPTPAVVETHRADRSELPFGWADAAGGTAAARWAGFSADLRLGAAVGGRSAPIADGALRFDWAGPSPWLVGLEVGHETSPRRAEGGFGDVRGVTRAVIRGGFALDDRWMIHADGGLAVSHGAEIRGRPIGWTAGLGLAYALDRSWALTLDYRFTRIGGRSAFLSPWASAGQRIDRDRSSILGSVTYRFLGL